MDKVIYFNNAPLAEVVFEIRFPGEPSIECDRSLFYQKIRDEFPKVLVPKLGQAEHPALQPYRFQDEEGTKSIKNSINTFSYDTNSYSVFSQFKEGVLRYLLLFCSLYKIEKINRTGLRYINHIPIEESRGLSDYLNAKLIIPEMDSNKFDRYRHEFSSQYGEGSMRVLIQSETLKIEKPPNTIGIPENILSGLEKFKKNKIILDFDYYIDHPDMNITMIEDYLETSHKHTKALFLSLLTEEYRKSLEELEYGG